MTCCYGHAAFARLRFVRTYKTQVYSLAGKGVFSTVVRARDTQPGGRDVVVKVIRRNDMMARASVREEKVHAPNPPLARSRGYKRTRIAEWSL